MSLLLPYFGAGFLLLVVLAIWARQNIGRHKGAAELLDPRQHRSNAGTTVRQRDLGERIFATEDWEFVSCETPQEIQQVFHRERSILAISWVRRTRGQISQVMRAHLIAARGSKNLRVATEFRLALSYFFYLGLCDLLIGLIWLRGPVRTRTSVRKTLRWLAQLRTAFGQLMARVDPASCRALRTNSSGGAV
jgi:hypothetical protein